MYYMAMNKYYMAMNILHMHSALDVHNTLDIVFVNKAGWVSDLYMDQAFRKKSTCL